MPVFELDSVSASEYLNRKLGIHPDRISELAGGVSNTVLLVEHGTERFVLKQSLPQLRVEQDWFSDRARILRECAALRMLSGQLPPNAVPAVLLEDAENFTFAMSAAPEGVLTWKARLMAGQIDAPTAESIGRLLGKVIASTWESSVAEAAFGDLRIFEELRLSPYYGSTALKHPDLTPQLEALSNACRTRRACLVHGDFSPKNFLIGPEGSVMIIDWECIHYGDPSFDSAFVLNHLLLKSFHMPARLADLTNCARRLWSALCEGIPPAPWFESATVGHLGGLLLARMDGKSPVEYIREPSLKQQIRDFARELIVSPPGGIEEVFERRGHWRCV